MPYIHDHTRSMQTIRTNTALIGSFPVHFRDHDDAVEVRQLLSRKSVNRQHFIITLKSDVARAEKISNSTSLVKPLTEVVVRDKRISFIYEVAGQHPDLKYYDCDISLQIEQAVESFMKRFYKMDHIDSSTALVKEWHRL